MIKDLTCEAFCYHILVHCGEPDDLAGRAVYVDSPGQRPAVHAGHRGKVVIPVCLQAGRATWPGPRAPPGRKQEQEHKHHERGQQQEWVQVLSEPCLLYTSPSPRDKRQSRMPSSA